MLFIILDSGAVGDCTSWMDPSWLSPPDWSRDDCYVVYVGY